MKRCRKGVLILGYLPSQDPHSLVPGGTGWSNNGLTYVENPLASNPVDINFDCMRKIIADVEIGTYTEKEAENKFISNII